jgi:ribonuclease VapC
MFVDASAIVAILNQETEADTFSDAIEQSGKAITSSIAAFEATLALCRIRYAAVEEAAADINEFLTVASIRGVPITAEPTQAALDAFARYGEGRGHPARLNLGDCFAYAVARDRAFRCCSRATTSPRPTSNLPPEGQATRTMRPSRSPFYSAACLKVFVGRQRSTGFRAASVSSRRRRGA